MNIKVDPKKTVFVIDGSSYLYRAYYSLRPLHTLEGIPVQAVYGFCRMIKKVIDVVQPNYLLLAWDSKGQTTREKIYPSYKKDRQAPPSDLFAQKELIQEFATIIGLQQIAQVGIEADDLMYSIAQEAKQEQLDTVFITSDKDLAQAIDAQIFWYDPMKDIFFNQQEFEKAWGFPPCHALLYYALVGDPSDSIPGVPGIGKIGAQKLAQQFATLESLYNNLSSVSTPRLQKSLQEHKDLAFLSRDLFRLQYHKTNLSRADLAFDTTHWKNAYPFFKKLNFKSFIPKNYTDSLEPQAILPEYRFVTVSTEQELATVCSLFAQSGHCGLDTETTGLDPLSDKCIGISLCFAQGTAYYIPFGHSNAQQLAQETVVEALKPFLENEQYKKYFHNAKFDLLALHMLGITLSGLALDTMVAARLVVQEWQKLSLKDLSEHYFKEPMLTYKAVVKDNKYKNFAEVPLQLATQYAAADAHQTFKLAQVLIKQLEDTQMSKLYYTIEHPLITILTFMEIAGIRVDGQELAHLGKQVAQELTQLEHLIIEKSELKQQTINLNSPRQIEMLLFDILKLPPQKKSSKKTAYSTDQEVLTALSALHPVPALILKYRELFKLKNTYIDALPTYINSSTGRIHTSFNQVAVATGRLSSSDPNLQNIPTDSGYGIEIRDAFKPDANSVFISADYSQIELRVLAHLSQDPRLIKAFLNNEDIHTQTAATLFDTPLADVTSAQRQVGKRINFSILYGLTPYGLSKELSIPFGTAKQYIEKYFALYTKMAAWMEAAVVEAQTYGYVTTYWGRRRYIPTIHEKNPTLAQEARRIAINTKVQGTAAEIMKLGMINLATAYTDKQHKAHMVLQIHDELLINVLKSESEPVAQLTRQVLESVVSWSIPLNVSIRLGDTWKKVTK